jgi:hypothetical protein
MEAEVKEQNRVDRLLGNVMECMETRFDLMAIEVQDKVSEIMASMASVLIVGVLFTLALFLVSIAGAIYLSRQLNSDYLGFVYVAGFYLLLGVLMYVSRKKLIKLPVINFLLRKINFHEED